jgi:DNA helicase-2/ATP-dependent DNA helicase PcrA
VAEDAVVRPHDLGSAEELEQIIGKALKNDPTGGVSG